MTEAIPIEVRKIGYRQSTKDGMVISFAVHPEDMRAEVAAAGLGTRYMMALVEIGDDEKPVEKPKEKRDYSLPQRVAMVCNEPAFEKFLCETEFEDRFMPDKDQVATHVRYLCGVDSRSEILPGTEAARKWDELHGKYLGWQRGME
jgi:hypothetical protein